MAVRRTAKKRAKPTVKEESAPAVAVEAKSTGWDSGLEAEPMDPGEEKMLDWILKGIVGFILGWLLLSILMVIGGYFRLWG